MSKVIPGALGYTEELIHVSIVVNSTGTLGDAGICEVISHVLHSRGGIQGAVERHHTEVGLIISIVAFGTIEWRGLASLR